MIFNFATSIVAAGCVVQAAADAPASIESAVAASAPSKEGDLLSSPTNNDHGRSAHRLLRRFKSRRKLAFRSERGEADGADLGALSSGSDVPRFLQNDYDYYCPRETCPTELCDCADEGGSLEDCTEELQNVCRAGQLSACVFEGYVQVYEEVYCPFVACTQEGFREAQCDCAFYDLYCARLNSDECNAVLQVGSDEEDKKPFFGCDETELREVCDQAHSCKARGDLQGLPDLGTWKGSVTTGIRSPAERVRQASAAGVALMSMLWFMMNG